MAEGINRPMAWESVDSYSLRLATMDPQPDRFEVAKALSQVLEQEFIRDFGEKKEAAERFEVHVRRQSLAIRCLVADVHGWHLAQKLARKGFGGRTVVLEKGWS